MPKPKLSRKTSSCQKKPKSKVRKYNTAATAAPPGPIAATSKIQDPVPEQQPELQLSASNRTLSEHLSTATPVQDEKEEGELSGEHQPQRAEAGLPSPVSDQQLYNNKQQAAAKWVQEVSNTTEKDTKGSTGSDISFPEADSFPELRKDHPQKAFDPSLSNKQQEEKVEGLLQQLPTGPEYNQRGQPGSKYENTWKVAYACVVAVMPPMLHKRGGSYAARLVQQTFYNIIDRHGYNMFRSMVREALIHFHVGRKNLGLAFDRFNRYYAEATNQQLDQLRFDFPLDIDTMKSNKFKLVPIQQQQRPFQQRPTVQQASAQPAAPTVQQASAQPAAPVARVQQLNISTTSAQPMEAESSMASTSQNPAPQPPVVKMAMLSNLAGMHVITLPLGTSMAKAEQIVGVANTLLQF